MTPPRRDAGVSLLELVIAMAVLCFALMALMSSITSSSTIQQNTREKVLAYNAAREVIEQMRAYPVTEIWSRYNSVISDNPVSGKSPGNTFTVAGLNVPSSGTVGRLFFPEKAGVLDETFVDAAMSMPKDLNRNGTATDTDVNSTYQILPVKVTVTWKVIGGQDVQIEVNTFIVEK